MKVGIEIPSLGKNFWEKPMTNITVNGEGLNICYLVTLSMALLSPF